MSIKDHDTQAQAQVDSIALAESEPTFLSDPLHDRLLEAAIALGGELWVERERRMRLEAVLMSKGVLTEQELESYALSDDERAEQNETLDALVKRLFGPLTTLPTKSN
jgi:hypothetical protein